MRSPTASQPPSRALPRADSQPGQPPSPEHRYETAKGCLLLGAALAIATLLGIAAIVLFGDYAG